MAKLYRRPPHKRKKAAKPLSRAARARRADAGWKRCGDKGILAYPYYQK